MTEELEGEEGRHELPAWLICAMLICVGSPRGAGLSGMQEGSPALCSAQGRSTNGWTRCEAPSGRGTTANSSL